MQLQRNKRKGTSLFCFRSSTTHPARAKLALHIVGNVSFSRQLNKRTAPGGWKGLFFDERISQRTTRDALLLFLEGFSDVLLF